MTALQLLDLLEDAVSDPTILLVAAPSLCRILQSAPGLSLQALDNHDAITMLAYVVKKQQQLDKPKVGQALLHQSSSLSRDTLLHCYAFTLLHCYTVSTIALRSLSAILA